jgi:hypothetical protein
MRYEKAEDMKSIDEFDQKVKIDPLTNKQTDQKSDVTLSQASSTAPQVKQEAQLLPETSKKKRKRKKKGEAEAAQISVVELPKVDPDLHEPHEVEGTEGFRGRRPLKDPFRVGEKVVHEVTYFGITAGSMSLEVLPFSLVNGRKSYQFSMRAWTRSLFETMYAADDVATNLLDFESLVPSAFFVHIKESKQLKEARGFFDSKAGLATYWEKRKTPDDPEEVKKEEWTIPEYSQNVYSAAFYMRTFNWKEGDEHAFRVTDSNKENLIFKAKALRKEVLKTAIGEFQTIVIKPEVQLQGVAKPVGDIFIWLSDDDRKYILRIEAKIRIGSLVSSVTELVEGQPDAQEGGRENSPDIPNPSVPQKTEHQVQKI